jgi:hypothetical protein
MKRIAIIAVVFICACNVGRADGGRLRFSKPAGPFIVTLFTTPEPLTPGTADFSVMVQDRVGGQVISNADVELRWVSPDGRILSASAKRGAAVNQLLEAAEVNLPTAGVWRVAIEIRDGDRAATCDAEITVERGSRKTTLIWIFTLLPALAIALFVLHQRQKHVVRLRRAEG